MSMGTSKLFLRKPRPQSTCPHGKASLRIRNKRTQNLPVNLHGYWLDPFGCSKQQDSQALEETTVWCWGLTVAHGGVALPIKLICSESLNLREVL